MNIINFFSSLSPTAQLKSFHVEIIQQVIRPILNVIGACPKLSDKIIRKKDSMQRELIEKNTLLSQPSPPVLKSVLDSPLLKGENELSIAKILAHFHGDTVIAGSRLQRLPAHVGPQIMEAYFTHHSPFEIPSEGFQKLKKGMAQLAETAREVHGLQKSDIPSYSQSISQKVYHLDPKASFFVPGKCVERGLTCSVVYEFLKNDEETYDLFVYMIGHEKGSFGDLFEDQKRKWSSPFIHFQKIPAKDLFFTGASNAHPQSDLFQALIETKVLEASPSYVSRGILAHFTPYFVPSKAAFTSPHSHTDAWKEISGISVRYLERETYKKLALDLKVRTLIEGYQLSADLLLEDTIEAAELREVLKKGATHILRALVSYRRNRWVEEELALQYQATAVDLQLRIGFFEKKIAQERIQKTLPPHLFPKETKGYSKDLEAAKGAIVLPKTETITIQSSFARLPKLWKPQAFVKEIQNFTAHFSENPDVISAEIEHLVDQFPIPESPASQSTYWENIKDLPEAIQGLENLLKRYDSAQRSAPIQITPREANTIYILYVTIHYLAIRLDQKKNKNMFDHPSSLAAYPIFFPGELYDHDPFLVYTSPRDFEKRKETRLYCEKSGFHKGYDPLFDYKRYWYWNREGAEKEGNDYNFFVQFVDVHGIKTKLFANPLEKAATLLPHLSPDQENNILKKAGMGYLSSLAYAAFLAHQYSGYTHLRNDPSAAFKIEVKPSFGWNSHEILGIYVTLSSGQKKINDYKGANESQPIYPSSSELHPDLSSQYSQTVQDRYLIRKRGYSNDKEEGEILNRKNPGARALERSALELSLHPHRMLYLYREHLEFLRDPQQQTLFEIEFFRTVVSSREPHPGDQYPPTQEWFPLQEEMKQDGFIKDCEAFIHEGIERYHDLQLGGKPHVMATLFFLRLACRLKRFSPKLNCQSVHYIQKMMGLKDLTATEKSALSLHLVLVYSTVGKKLSDQEKKEIFRCWVYYKNAPLEAEWKSVFVEKEAAAFIHTLIPSKESALLNSLYKKELLGEVLQLLGMGELTPQFKMDETSFPNIKASSGNGQYWEINLLTGKVNSDQGLLVKSALPNWIPKEKISHATDETIFYKYLFGGREHVYFQTGTAFYFQDPFIGQLRVINGNLLTGLQRKIKGEWHHYVSPEIFKNSEIPSALLADHTHWIPCSQPNSLLICDFKTGHPVALLQEDAIYPISQDLQETDFSRALTAIDKSSLLTRFDSYSYILCTLNNNYLEKIAFSRFRSQSGEPLYFEIQNEKVVYGLNRKFYLCENQQQGLLGGIDQYLLFVDGEGERRKILIPRRPLSSYQPLTQRHKISTLDPQQGYNDDKHQVFQKGTAIFLEYDLKGNQIVPLSPEGTLHLAYLYLAQREYVRAKDLIERMNPRQRLSPLSVLILDDLMNICEEGHDRSPESAAVVLWAFRLMQKASKRHPTIKSCKKPYEAFAIYARYRQTIPASLEYPGKISLCEQRDRYAKLQSIIKGNIHSLHIIPLEHPNAGFKKDYSSGHLEAYSNYVRAAKQTQFLQEKDPSFKGDDFLSTPYGKGYAQSDFFRTAYHIALQGSQAEKEKLSFRLQLMEALRSEGDQPPHAWTILQFALRFPHLVPTDLPSSKDIKGRWEYLLKMGMLILNTEQPPPQISDSRRPESIPLATQLKIVFPEKKQVQPIEEKLILSSPDKNKIDGDFLKKLFSTHFELKPEKKIALSEINLTYEPQAFQSDDEKSAEKAILKEFEIFQEGLRGGTRLNQEGREKYEAKDLLTLKEELEKKTAALSIDLHNLEATILELANRSSPGTFKELQLLRDSKVDQELTLKKLIWIFLSGDQAAFKRSNGYLMNHDFETEVAEQLGVENQPGIVIDYLYNLIGLYLTVSIYKQRLERATHHLEKLAKGHLLPLEQDDLIQKIAFELNPKNLNTYSIQENPTFLVFEYYSELPLRVEQVTNLLKLLEIEGGKYRNQLRSMMMGGGKTSVLAVIILHKSAQQGLSLFCTTSSQYSSVTHNLRKALKSYFDQDMEEIDFPPEEIYQKCGQIEKRMRKAILRGDFLPVKSETLLYLQLKFVTAIFDAVGNKSDSIRAVDINTLRRILEMLRQHGELMIDEIDLVLHILREMNFPRGEKQYVVPERIDLIRELFVLFVSESVPIDGNQRVNLKELIKLQENRQTLLSEIDFKEIVTRAVAWKFARDSQKLMLHAHPEYHLSFYRYISGSMNPVCQKVLDHPQTEWEPTAQDQIDLKFLHYVRELRYSQVPENVEASHQIALVKHMMRTVLKTTFQKMGNRHFGRGKGKPGEVRPYLAVDTPSDNYFGYIYEWIAYHFQTALQCGIGTDQIHALAAIYCAGATAAIQAKQFVVDEESGEILPPEALEFKQLTGVNLEEVERAEKLELAAQNVQKNVPARLQLEATTISDLVFYYPYRVTANGFSLANMCNTTRGMSATLNNAHCYEDRLADHFTPQKEIEGQVADVITTRMQTEEKKQIHLVKSRNLEGILDATLSQHPQRGQVRMLLDAGALFKDDTNLEVAKALKKRLNLPVLFFMRDPTKNEKTPDTLAILPLDSDQPRIIGGTRLEDIEKTGFSIHDYFAYIDERHTTGTDLPMPFDTIGLMTCDEAILDRTIWQTIFRLRQIFFEQRIEFIIPHDILPLLLETLKQDQSLRQFLETEKTSLDQKIISLALLRKALLNQAMAKGKEYIRSRKQKIDSLFEQTLLIDYLLIGRDLTQKDFDQVAPFKHVMEIPQEDLPYDQVGALEMMVDSIEDLVCYGKKRLDHFRKAQGNEETAKKIEEEIHKVIEKAALSPWMLKQTPSPGVNELNMEVDLLTEVNQEINQDVNQEIDQELLQELEIYEQTPPSQLRPEDIWDHQKIEAFLSTFPQSPVGFKNIFPLIDWLQGYVDSTNKPVKYRKDYHTIFDKRIWVSQNWGFTTDRKLPIFHRLQRPVEQILLIKNNDGYQAILLSQHEATQFKTFLHRQYGERKWDHVWLILPDLKELEDNPSGPPPAYEIADLIIPLNALNGNIHYLEAHSDQTQQWLSQDSPTKLDFLRLRIERNPSQKKRFMESPLLGGQQRMKHQIQSASLREKVRKMTRKQIQNLKGEDKKTLWMLSEQQLPLLHPDQVSFLHPYQMGKLRGKPWVSQIPEKHKNAITREQWPDLSDTQKEWFFKPDKLPIEPVEIMDTSVEEPILPSEKLEMSVSDSNSQFTPSLSPKISVPSMPLQQESFHPKKVKKDEKSVTITTLALIALGILASGASVVGSFATIGFHASWAPQFMVTIAQGLQWQYIGYVLIAIGPIYGITVAIVKNCRSQSPA